MWAIDIRALRFAQLGGHTEYCIVDYHNPYNPYGQQRAKQVNPFFSIPPLVDRLQREPHEYVKNSLKDFKMAEQVSVHKDFLIVST